MNLPSTQIHDFCKLKKWVSDLTWSDISPSSLPISPGTMAYLLLGRKNRKIHEYQALKKEKNNMFIYPQISQHNFFKSMGTALSLVAISILPCSIHWAESKALKRSAYWPSPPPLSTWSPLIPSSSGSILNSIFFGCLQSKINQKVCFLLTHHQGPLQLAWFNWWCPCNS